MNGIVTYQAGSSPSAGAEVNFNATGLWLVRYLTFTLATSSTVANRYVEVGLFDGSGEVLRFNIQGLTGGASDTSTAQVASKTWKYRMGVTSNGSATEATNFLQVIGNSWGSMMPLLQSGWSLQTVTANLQAGDQYSAVSAGLEVLG